LHNIFLDYSTISNNWKAIFDKIPDDIKNKINLIPDNDNILPKKELRLAAMTYFEPKDTKVVIIGQDPYINKVVFTVQLIQRLMISIFKVIDKNIFLALNLILIMK
jgi:uracil DNA glycosylase